MFKHRVFFFQAEDGIRDDLVTGVQTCALPISLPVLLQVACTIWLASQQLPEPAGFCASALGFMEHLLNNSAIWMLAKCDPRDTFCLSFSIATCKVYCIVQ